MGYTVRFQFRSYEDAFLEESDSYNNISKAAQSFFGLLRDVQGKELKFSEPDADGNCHLMGSGTVVVSSHYHLTRLLMLFDFLIENYGIEFEDPEISPS